MKIPAINLDRLNSQKGSASILVIMLSLTLVVFGVFSMMTAHAGLAVARRHGEWNTKHHEVESEAALIAAEIHHLAIGGTADFIHSMKDETNLLNPKETIMERVEQGVTEKNLPVTITWGDHTTGADEVAFQVEISVMPPPEERNGFYGALQFTIDLSKRDQPRVMVDRTAWKSVTEAFEYKEGIEFRDVEVEVQVE